MPCIAWGHGVPRGAVTEALLNTPDLLPTCLDLAGIADPDAADRPRALLHDTVADPHDEHDLIADPAHRPTAEVSARRLCELMHRLGDTRHLPAFRMLLAQTGLLAGDDLPRAIPASQGSAG